MDNWLISNEQFVSYIVAKASYIFMMMTMPAIYAVLDF
jgi:hypothetical protein